MYGFIYDKEFTANAEALFQSLERADSVLLAVEWQLERTTDFAKYQVVGKNEHGDVYCLQTQPRAIAPALVVVFGFETHVGTRKIVLLAVRKATPDKQ